MSSERCGVQAEIKKHSPLAVYTHCAGHRLNLVISHSCSVGAIKYMIDKLKSCCIFFLSSDKRIGFLTEIVQSEVLDLGKCKPLIDICKTRWAERHIATHFYTSFKFIVTALEVISLGLHKGKYDELFTACSWDAKSKSDAVFSMV